MTAPAETLSRVQLNRAILARQALLERRDESAVAMVERLAGMQAQEPKPPYVGLWTRLARFERDDLSQALHEHEIVRATLMRGTLHVMSGRDYLALRQALQPMLSRTARGILNNRSSGFDREALIAVARELLNEAPRTFNELRPLLL